MLDGGAYASTSSAVLINGITHAQGPYQCDNATVDGWAVRTNNLPCGAMRGFGVVQACFAHEAQMDKLAAACGLDPVEIRLLQRDARPATRLITGQVDRERRACRRVHPRDCGAAAARPARRRPRRRSDAPARWRRARPPTPAHIRRGIGWGVAIKNLMYCEGFDDYSTARCRLADGVASVKFATVEVGQGFVTLAEQIARTVLGVDDVVLEPIDTTSRLGRLDVGVAPDVDERRRGRRRVPAGPRAVVRTRRRACTTSTRCGCAIDGNDVVDTVGTLRVPVAEATAGIEFDETFEHHHRPTEDLDENGQGNCHTAFAFVAHRAVVDVDPELGLVKVVQIATAQDVGGALNPLSVVGQIEGGIAQGLGLAVMEEIISVDGHVRNASFTDYLLPTFLDMPDVVISLIEEPDPMAPLGPRASASRRRISSTPAVVAAIRDAIGKDLSRVPGAPRRHLSVS